MSRLGARSSVVAGLLAGIAAAVVLIAGVVAFAPEPVAPRPTPAVLPSATAATATTVPSLAAPSIAASAAPGSSTATRSLFHVGEPAPPLVSGSAATGLVSDNNPAASPATPSAVSSAGRMRIRMRSARSAIGAAS